MFAPVNRCEDTMMKTKSRVLFQNQHYAACLMRDGALIVQNLRKGTGRRLLGSQVADWATAIEAALDRGEANDLCRGFLE